MAAESFGEGAVGLRVPVEAAWLQQSRGGRVPWLPQPLRAGTGSVQGSAPAWPGLPSLLYTKLCWLSLT